MPRSLTGHRTNPANDKLNIDVTDEPGQGGACHRYEITGFDGSTNPSAKGGVTGIAIVFQNGPIKEFGVNGVTQEALLEIIIDRLRSFQEGPFKCRENAIALTHIETAKHWLNARTLERMARGVEGTNQK